MDGDARSSTLAAIAADACTAGTAATSAGAPPAALPPLSTVLVGTGAAPAPSAAAYFHTCGVARYGFRATVEWSTPALWWGRALCAAGQAAPSSGTTCDGAGPSVIAEAGLVGR